jgi:hypothetical protein
MSIPLNIIITNPKHNKYNSMYFTCNDIDECYNKVVISVKNAIILNVDYPADYEEFKNLIWYNSISFDNEIFDYSIFIENEWKTPWTHQEIYDQICEIIHTVDLQNSIYNKKNTYDYNSDEDEEN